MIEATALKNGVTFSIDGKPYQVVKYELQKIARGAGTVKISMRNLETGQLEQKTMKSSLKVEDIVTNKRPLQYLFSDTEVASFMDEKTFEQVEIPVSVVSNQLSFIKEGEKVNVLFWDDRALAVDIAPKVDLEVTYTEPAAKGNSATNVFKPATLENGLEVKVPLFIKMEDKVRIDTRTITYVERAK